MTAKIATLTFDRTVAAPVPTLWQVWTAPSARAIWSSPAPEATVEFLEADTVVGGREVSICKADGQPDVRVEAGWLHLQTGQCSVNYEVVLCDGERQSAALVTADFAPAGEGSRVVVTVQLSSLVKDMKPGYQQGFGTGMDKLSGVAERTMVLDRVIKAPVSAVWAAWWNAQSLPVWWGPDGFSCRTKRIDLRVGGEWVFDMIGPDGTVFPNHHCYGQVKPESRIEYSLLWGENGPKHADAWVDFTAVGDATKVTLCMVLATSEEFQQAKSFGAIALGLQTLGKLARVVEAN